MPSAFDPVTVSLQDLQDGSLPFERLQEAFGPESLGILIVKDLPPHFLSQRHRALSFASYLGNLPPEILASLENTSARYLIGWSIGKEVLKDGQPDTNKGSFYTNCAFYVDPALDCAQPTGEFSARKFPEYLTANVWPSEAALPGLKTALEALCRTIIDVAVLVARACDRFAEQDIEGYPKGYVEHVVKTSTTTKARLLHYRPHPSSSKPLPSDNDDWCATHLDHGCLTGLTSAMFVDEDVHPTLSLTTAERAVGSPLPPLEELSASPDPDAGLYINSRDGSTVHVHIPRDCLAFQTGETLERITRGRFRAVPHFVRGVRSSVGKEEQRVARNTLAVFTQPNLGEEVDTEQHITFGDFARGVVARNAVVPVGFS